MLQFDLPENMWEDSRRMATFIYNRVPPTRQTPGEEWLSPHQKQYPTRETMDLTKLQPFGIPCWVYQKKPIRDRGYSGKSDKKERAIQGRLVGYNDSQGPLHAKVYYPGEGISRWHPEELLEYADAMAEVDKMATKPRAKEMEAKPKEYFDAMVGTRHTDPEDGITYETTEVKTNKQGYIVAYRREICKGKPVGSIDGPYHVADIYEYTKKNVDNLVRIAGLSSGDSSPGDEEPGGRTVEPSLIGGRRGRQASPKDVDELLTTGKSRTTHRPNRPREMSKELRSTEKKPSNQKSTHTKNVSKLHGYHKGMEGTWMSQRLDLCLVK